MLEQFRRFESVSLKVLSFALLFLLFACSSSTLSPSASTAPAQFGSPDTTQVQNPSASSALSQIDQSQLIEAQQSRAKKKEILFSARVKRLLPDDTKGLPHQRFLLEIENGSTVLVAHDTKYAPKVPIQVGDILVIKGEYIWNRKGGIVHWTHRSDTPKHEGGYIEFDGQRYQ